VEEIAFDLAARQEYLTGFHKRKLQRAKHAQEAAGRRARAVKLEERKQVREQRKAELERHVEEVNAMLKPLAAIDDEEDEQGISPYEDQGSISDSELPLVDHEAEYIDEEKYTTVTVETMDVSKEGLFKAQQGADQPALETTEKRAPVSRSDHPFERQKRKWTKEKPKDGIKKRKKKRNFKYEGRAERREARSKEKSRNRKQARERRADG